MYAYRPCMSVLKSNSIGVWAMLKKITWCCHMHQPSVNWISVCEAHLSSTQQTPQPVTGVHARLVRECLGHTPPNSGGPVAASPTPCMRVLRVTNYKCCMIDELTYLCRFGLKGHMNVERIFKQHVYVWLDPSPLRTPTVPSRAPHTTTTAVPLHKRVVYMHGISPAGVDWNWVTTVTFVMILNDYAFGLDLARETQSNTPGVWPCKLPIVSLPLQLLAMLPDLMSDLSKHPRPKISTSVAGWPAIRNKSLLGVTKRN